MLNLPFHVEATADTYEIKVTQGSYLVNPNGSLGTHNTVGVDNAAIDFRRPEGAAVFSSLAGTVVGAHAGYADALYASPPTSGPATFGNYITLRYDAPEAGGVFFATFAHLSRATVQPWVDRLVASPSGVSVNAAEFLGEVAGVLESPYDVHLHVSFGRTTLDTFAYAAPNAVADASVSTANAALLASLSIDGIRLSDAVIGDYVTANVVGRGTDIGDYFSGAARQDHLQGLAGSDTLVGFDGADTLLGGADHDRLDGGSGNDSLLGGTGNDVYSATQDDIIVERANEGFDAVWVVGGTSYVIPAHVEMMLFAPGQPLIATGNALANTMVGNENANILQGFGSGDQIDGGAGADTLVGGLGRDTLHGGTGADHFRFDAVTHSDTLFPDLIVDFTFTAIERDRINLAVIDANTALAGNQGFTFIGANAFTGAAGELRATPTAGLGYAVAGDTNGDRAADFVINVVSAATPSSGWFIL